MSANVSGRGGRPPLGLQGRTDGLGRWASLGAARGALRAAAFPLLLNTCVVSCDVASGGTVFSPLLPAASCASDAECASSGQSCNTARQLCVQCVSNAQCSTSACVDNQCIVPVSCNTNAECPHVCSGAPGVCVDCVVDVDCSAGLVCAENQCALPRMPMVVAAAPMVSSTAGNGAEATTTPGPDEIGGGGPGGATATTPLTAGATSAGAGGGGGGGAGGMTSEAEAGAGGAPLEERPEPGPALLDDFEDGDGFIRVVEGRVGPWRTYNGGGNQTPAPGTALIPESGGARETALAAHTFGSFQGYGGLVVDLNNPNAALGDGAESTRLGYFATDYAGIRFYAKGTGDVAVKFDTAETVETGKGGTCTADCFQSYERVITLSSSWTEYTLEFSNLAQPDGAAQKPFNTDNLIAIAFQFVSSADFDFWVDEITFY